MVTPPPKEAISLRVDQDVLAWFRAGGQGYQTRMNAVLRSYMQAKRDPSAQTPKRSRRTRKGGSREGAS